MSNYNLENSNNSVLITGASGLLGSHVVKQLLEEKKQDFTVLVRNEHQEKIWNSLGINTIQGDLENPVFTLPSTIKTVVHIAAIAGDWVDKTKAQAVNVKGTEYLIHEAEKVGCQKFIYVSTIGVYGHVKYENATETRKLKSSSTYEKTKLKAEKFIQKYKKANRSSMDFIIVRPSSMYGEGDRFIIPGYSRFLKTGKMVLISEGKSLYPIIHAADVASVLVQLMNGNGNYTNGTGLNVFNLCDDSRITQKEFISIIKDNIGVKDELKSIPYLPAYLASILFEVKGKLTGKEPRIFRKRVKYLGITRNVSIAKARNELGFSPKWNPQQGIPSVLESLEEENKYRSNGYETNVLNGIKEKEILDVIPYHLFIQIKNN